MFRDGGGSVRNLTVDKDEIEAFGERASGRWAVPERRSVIFPLLVFFVFSPSPPLSVCVVAPALRSSVTLDDVTSLRSLSKYLVFCVVVGTL